MCVLISIWVIIIGAMVCFFLHGMNEYKKMEKDFISRNIEGRISSVEDAERGFYCIRIEDKVAKKSLLYQLPQSFFFKENKIRKGDSVSKEMNSTIMTFYKFDKGIYKECCDYKIGT